MVHYFVYHRRNFTSNNNNSDNMPPISPFAGERSKSKPAVIRLEWHEFAKKFQAENNLKTYADALTGAPAAWKAYKESFEKENPSYDKHEVTTWRKNERAKKIEAGEIAPPKPRSRKQASPKKNNHPSALGVPTEYDSAVTGKVAKSFTDSDGEEYDLYIRGLGGFSKKRKRKSSPPSASGATAPRTSKDKTAATAADEDNQPPAKKKRVRRTKEEIIAAKKATEALAATTEAAVLAPKRAKNRKAEDKEEKAEGGKEEKAEEGEVVDKSKRRRYIPTKKVTRVAKEEVMAQMDADMEPNYHSDSRDSDEDGRGYMTQSRCKYADEMFI